ncbi:MAG: alpha/beta hydrolase [Bacteroidales bacterium]|nr:alpha/beta hydrolase [Bacteroidales bacterium]
MNSGISTIQERLKQASDARAQEAAGGKVIYAADTPMPTEEEELAKIPFDLYREGYIYYGNTHAHPNSIFRYTMSSLLDLMAFDASTNMNLINQPLLMIAGSKADTYYMTDDCFNNATGTKEKELFLIQGATHIQTYYVPEYVNQAMNKLNDFFKKYLK